MAETPKRSGPTALSASSATIYTALGASTWSILRSIMLCNESATDVQVTVGVGTTNADAAGKRILRLVQVPSYQTVDYPSLFIPLAGHASTPDLVYGFASVASALTITLGVVEGP